MKPIRILQVVTIMNRGGLETMLMNYYRQIDRTLIQFDFMVHRKEKGHYDDEIRELGGRIYSMPTIRPGHYREYFKLLDHFFNRHQEYKVVHSHINENSSFVLKAAKKAGVPCRIAHSHLSDLGIDYKLPFRLFARRAMRGNPTNYFACSVAAGKWLFGKEVSKKNITVLNNAVNIEEFQYNQSIREKLRSELNIQNKLVIGHIGRFNKQKNHQFLIEIFKEVHKKQPNSILVLVGEGRLRPSIEKRVKDLALEDHVFFLGVKENIPELMQCFDLFLFPSLFEGLPVVLVEAQAAGLTCIVSDRITREADVTGNIDFLSLDEGPNRWAEHILSSSFEHKDTLEILKRKRYDTKSMADWLSGYYLGQVITEKV